MAQLPFIKQNQVSAGISKTRSNAVKVYCSEAIAAGDVVFTAMKGVNAKAMYFNGTFEVEF